MYVAKGQGMDLRRQALNELLKLFSPRRRVIFLVKTELI